MSADELLTTCRQAGIILRAEGDSLEVDAPRGTLTPELKDALVRHKPAILAILAPIEYVTLRGGLVVPEPALTFALDLEARGFRLSLDECQQFMIEATPHSGPLTDGDRAAIARSQRYLGAIVAYEAPEVA